MTSPASSSPTYGRSSSPQTYVPIATRARPAFPEPRPAKSDASHRSRAPRVLANVNDESRQGHVLLTPPQASDGHSQALAPRKVTIPTTTTTSSAPRDLRAAPRPTVQPLRSTNASPRLDTAANEVDETTEQQHSSSMWAPEAVSGFPFPDGDTQPMDSQIYKNFTTSMLEAREGDDTLDVIGSFHGHEGTGGGGTEGEDGRPAEVDIAWEPEGYDEHEPISPLSYDGNHDNKIVGSDSSPDTRFHVDQPTSPTKFLPPETPAMVGHKRVRQGDSMSSAIRTPGSALAFPTAGLATGAQMMSLTQLFNNTQARTSPIVGDIRSDPVFQKPSPGYPGFRQSSPLAQTSPPQPPPLTSETSRLTTTSEPRDTYRSMKESQEERQRRLLAEQRRFADIRGRGNDGSDEEPTPEELRAQRRKKVREESEFRLGRMARVSAPSKKGATPAGRIGKPVVISSDAAYITPGHPRRKGGRMSESMLSDSESADELADDLSSSIRSTKSGGAGIEVPMTSSRGDQSSRPLIRDTPSLRQRRHSHTQGHKRGDQAHVAGTASQPNTGTQSGIRSPTSTQTTAIPDTQPIPVETLDEDDEEAQPDKGVEAPELMVKQQSIPSIQAKLGGKTPNRHFLGTVDTSSIPCPPPSSSQTDVDEEVRRIQSSPPLMHSEHSHGEEDEADLAEGGATEHFLDADDAQEQETEATPTRSTQRSANNESLPVRLSSKEADASPLDSEEASAEKGVLLSENVSNTTGNTSIVFNELLGATSKKQGNADSNSKPESVSSYMANTATHGTETWGTAATHFSASQQKAFLSQNSKTSSPSPRPMRTFRKLTEIAAEANDAPESSIKITNLNDFRLVTKEDEQLADFLRSPEKSARKRRKVYSSKTKTTLPSPKKRETALVQPARSIWPTTVQVSQEQDSAMEIDPPVGDLPLAPVTAVSTPPTITSTITSAPASVLPAPNLLFRGEGSKMSVKAGKAGKLTRPSKASSLRVSKSATQLRTIPRPTEIAETPQPKQFQGMSKISPPPDSEKIPSRRPSRIDQLVMEENDDESGRRIIPQEPLKKAATGSTSDSDGLMVPHRVLALFRGMNMSYYPATCIGLGLVDNVPKYRIRFDDGSVDEQVGPDLVKSLNLQFGDQVKVDLNEMRKNLYTVVGFKDRIDSSQIGPTKFPQTDQHGHLIVSLQVCHASGGRSKSKTKNKNSSIFEAIDVSISSLYLPQTLWTKFKGRPYTYPTEPLTKSFRLQTPSRVSDQGSPTSRPRNSHLKPIATRFPSSTSLAAVQTGGIFANMAFAVSHANESQRLELTKLITIHGGTILDPGFEALFQSSTINSNMTGALSPLKKSAKSQLTIKSPAGARSLMLTQPSKYLGFVALISNEHSRRPKYLQALALGIPCLATRWIRDCVTSSSILSYERYLLPAGKSSFLDGAIRSRSSLEAYLPDSADAHLTLVLERRNKLLDGHSITIMFNAKGNAKTPVDEKRRVYTFLGYAMGARRVQLVKDIQEARNMVSIGDSSGLAIDTPTRVRGKEAETHYKEDTDRDELAPRESNVPLQSHNPIALDWVLVDTDNLDDATSALFGLDTFTSTTGKSSRASTRKRKRVQSTDGDTQDGTPSVHGSGSGMLASADHDFREGIINGRKVRVVADEFLIQMMILEEMIA